MESAFAEALEATVVKLVGVVTVELKLGFTGAEVTKTAAIHP